MAWPARWRRCPTCCAIRSASRTAGARRRCRSSRARCARWSRCTRGSRWTPDAEAAAGGGRGAAGGRDRGRALLRAQARRAGRRHRDGARSRAARGASPSCPSAGTTRCSTAGGSPRATRRWRRSGDELDRLGVADRHARGPQARRALRAAVAVDGRGRRRRAPLRRRRSSRTRPARSACACAAAATRTSSRSWRALGVVTRTFDSWWVSIHGDGRLRALLEARPELQGDRQMSCPRSTPRRSAPGAADALEALSSAEEGRVEVDGLTAPLRPFQGAAVDYALRARRTFLSDEPGPGQDDPGARDARGRRRLPGADRRARVAAPELAARGRALAAAPHPRRAVRRRRDRRHRHLGRAATRSPIPWSTARSPRRRARSSSTSRTSARTRRRAARRRSPRSPTRSPTTRSSCCCPARPSSTAPRSSRRS